MKVLPLTIEDAEGIASLEATCFPGSAWPKKEIDYELSENPCAILLGVKEEGKLVAYIDFMITFTSATISRLAVLPAYRRKGYAKALLEAMVKRCKEEKEDVVEWITLEVRASNRAAHELYHSNGYQDITVKKAYYDDGEDAIYMMRSLL